MAPGAPGSRLEAASLVDARGIRGSRVQERIGAGARVLERLQLTFRDGSSVTLGCAGDGRSLRVEPQRIRVAPQFARTGPAELSAPVGPQRAV